MNDQDILTLVGRIDALATELVSIREELVQRLGTPTEVREEEPARVQQPLFVPKEESPRAISGMLSPAAALISRISVVDLYRFRRELCGDNHDELEALLAECAELRTPEELKQHLTEVRHFSLSNDTVIDLYHILSSLQSRKG